MLFPHLKPKFLPTLLPILDGWHSSNFGYRIDPFTGAQSFHEGIDFPAETGTPKSHLVLMALEAWRQAGHPAAEDTEERTIPERLSVPQADRQAINALSAELGVPISPMIRAAVAWWLTTEPQVPTWQTKGDQAQALLRARPVAGDTALCEKVNAALTEMVADGSWDKAVEDNLGAADYTPGPGNPPTPAACT